MKLQQTKKTQTHITLVANFATTYKWKGYEFIWMYKARELLFWSKYSEVRI
jgi:hypothetical protein